MNEPNPTPAFRLGCGSIVCGYRLVRCVGRGWESTSYLAHEEHSGVIRRLKFFRPGDDFLPQQIGHIAATFERLASSGAVPAYHHMRVWQRGRQDIPFLVFGYIDGIPLTKLLEPGRWRRGWTDRKAVKVLKAIATKLGAVHAGGLGIGDFASGNNILVTAEDDVIWCDIDAGWPWEPFGDLASDAWDFFTILDLLAAHAPDSPLIARVCRKLARLRERKRWSGGLVRIAAVLETIIG